MTVTVYSAVASFFWCNLFAVIICLYLKKDFFLIQGGIYPVMFLILLFLIRLFMKFELTTTYVVSSFSIYPILQTFLLYMPFISFSDRITMTVLDILYTVWITGTVFYIIRLLWQNIRFHFVLMRKSVPAGKHTYDLMSKICKLPKTGRNFQIVWTPLIDVPIITGFFRPVICLPNIELTDQELGYVLKHEWNHFTHKDLWVKLIFEIIYAVYWWNPLFYFLKKKLDDTLELKNDLLISKSLTKKEKAEYLNTILKIAVKKQNNKQNQMIQMPSLGLINHTQGLILKKRFQLVLRQKERTGRQKAFSSLIHLLFIVLFVVSYCFVIQPAGYPPEYYEGTITPVYGETSYLLYNDDGTYSFYENNTYKGNIKDITEKPYCDLEIVN